MHPKSAHANFVLFLCGALLLLLAVYLTVSPFADDAGMLRLVSVVLIVAGLLYALAFAQNKRWYFRPGWTLQQSFFMIFFGIILCFRPTSSWIPI